MKEVGFIFFIILLLSSFGQVTSDLYLPSLSAISESFNSNVNLVQLTVSFYMYGFALSQLVFGLLSDGLGRKFILVIGLLICVVSSFYCAYSESIFVLIISRLFQGFGAGAGTSISRAILRDVISGTNFAKLTSYLAIVNVSVITTAPLIGGYIQSYWGWRANFYFLLIYSFILLLLIVLLLPETNKFKSLDKLKLSRIKNNVYELIKNPIFMGYNLCLSLMFGGIMAWLTVSPILLVKVLGISPIEFGWGCVFSGISYGVANLINSQVVTRIGLNRMINIGLNISLISGLSLLMFYIIGYINLIVIILPSFLFIFGSGFVMANTIAGALESFPKIAGLAGSMNGFMQIAGGAITSTVLSYTIDINQLPLALVLVSLASIAITVFYFLIKKGK
jgi:Bcr/CflA subfamily drug resistance transporter